MNKVGFYQVDLVCLLTRMFIDGILKYTRILVCPSRVEFVQRRKMEEPDDRMVSGWIGIR